MKLNFACLNWYSGEQVSLYFEFASSRIDFT